MSDKTISITVSGTMEHVDEMLRRFAACPGVSDWDRLRDKQYSSNRAKLEEATGDLWERGERTELADPRVDTMAAPPTPEQHVHMAPVVDGASEPAPVDAAAVFAGLPGGTVTEAPVIPTTPAPPVTATDLDGEGLPWDRRIHASTKTRRQSDNTWKLLKGIDPAVVEQVKGELRTAMSAQPAPAAAPPAPAAAPSIVPELSGSWSPETGHVGGVPAPPAAPPAPAAAPVIATFAELLQAVTAAQVADKIAHTQIIDVCKKHGFANLPLVAARPDMIPTVYADLCAIWGA